MDLLPDEKRLIESDVFILLKSFISLDHPTASRSSSWLPTLIRQISASPKQLRGGGGSTSLAGVMFGVSGAEGVCRISHLSQQVLALQVSPPHRTLLISATWGQQLLCRSRSCPGIPVSRGSRKHNAESYSV